MKKYILFFIVIAPFSLLAQTPVVEWAKTFGGSNIEFANAIIVTKDNKYLLCGHTSSSDGDVTGSYGGSDAWLIKLDENGNTLWKKNYGGSGNESILSIFQTLDEGFIMVGSTNSTDGDVPRNDIRGYMWVVKIDSIGNIQWQKTIGGSKGETALSVFQTKNGDYIIGAYSSSSDYDFPQNAGERDWWVLKLNNQGNIVWKKRIGGSKSDHLSEIVNIDDKTFAIAGRTHSNDGDMVGAKGDFSVKMDSSGNILWKKSFGSPFDTIPWFIEFHAVTMSQNDIVSVGTMIKDLPLTSPIPYTWDFLVTKSDTAGNRKWSKLFGGSRTEDATSVKAFPNGDLLVTGYTQSNDGEVQNNHGDLDFWVVRLDSLGNLKNANCYGGSKSDKSNSSVIDKKGNVLIAGYSYSSDGTFTQNKGAADWAIVKLRYPGTSVKESRMDETAIVEYPNPVQDELTIRISQNIAPNLVINDVLGKQMYRLNHLSPETTINMTSFPNGVYILTYQLESETFSRKIIRIQ